MAPSAGMIGLLRDAAASHRVAAHTAWAATWTVLFAVLAVVVGGDRPQPWWVLGMLGLLGLWHLMFRVGRWAHRRGATNALTRRATVLAWVLPVAFPVFVLFDAVTG